MNSKEKREYTAKVRKSECETCGSQFELTLQHLCQEHNSRDHNADCAVKTLCWTCHCQEDFKKNLECYTKAMFKRYDKAMKKEGL